MSRPAPPSPPPRPARVADGFPGSYRPQDVTFLLKPVELAPTDVAEKERLIQSGQAHYSEMIGQESAPPPRYLELFHGAMDRHADRFALDLARLAKALAARQPAVSAILSLARAGTPMGVLLRRGLQALGCEVPHYAISIIRDRGLDAVALDAVVAAGHDPAGWVFVDGWTGKGAIRGELDRAWTAYRQRPPGAAASRHGLPDRAELCVVADLAGVADTAVSGEDYLIPCSILNAVVSGLVSRTILNDRCVGPGDFHACVLWEHLRQHDLSRWFVDALTPRVQRWLTDPAIAAAAWPDGSRAARHAAASACVDALMARYQVADRNRVKPGIGEATRALLRRVPERLILAEPNAPDLAHLEYLAHEKSVPIDLDPGLAYRAATVIRSLGQG